MKYILETDRLKLRELTIEDADFIITLLNSPGWLEFIGERNVRTKEQAKAYIENGPIKSYAENGFGLSLVETKDTLEPIGMCGMLKRDSLDSPDIGFAFLQEFTGKGYAFEIANATLSNVRDRLNILKVSAIIKPGNERSIRLIEKLGLRFIQTFSHPNSTEELLLYQN
jgi:RimJ/RimL family protein N-acetyltransferase